MPNIKSARERRASEKAKAIGSLTHFASLMGTESMLISKGCSLRESQQQARNC
jgi:hypothetical protein